MILKFSNGEFDAQVGDVFYCTGDAIYGCSSSVTRRTDVPWEIVGVDVEGWEIAARPLSNENDFDGYLHTIDGFYDPHYYLFRAHGLQYEAGRHSSSPCYYCGQIHEDIQIIDGRRICPDCLVGHTFTCIECGKIHDTRRRMKGINLCYPCFERLPEKYRRALDDGRVYLATDLIETVDMVSYTPAYAESNLAKCCECGRYIRPGNSILYEGNTYCHRHIPHDAVRCAHCGTYHLTSEMTVVNGKYVCKECLSINYLKCANCGEYFLTWSGGRFEDTNERICTSCCDKFKCNVCGRVYRNHEGWSHDVTVWTDISRNYVHKLKNVCRSCMNTRLCKCADCDDYINPLNNFNRLPDRKYYCGNHIYNHFVRCNECGSWKSRSERFIGSPDDCVCIECFDDANHGTYNGYSGDEEEFIAESGIMDYNEKPDPIFYPNTNITKVIDALYMGVELEVDGGYDEDEVVDHANEIFKITYGKHDGSLGRHGIEFVSHPATIDYFNSHKDRFITAMKYLRRNGYSSHSAGTCGLHVHVSSFPLIYESDNGIEKLLYLQDKFWKKLFLFSRRDSNTANRWAKRISIAREASSNHVDSNTRIAALKKSKDSAKNNGRYQCINLQNRHTVEFRLMRGTLNVDTFMATLQLISNLCELVIVKTMDEICALTWEDVISYHDYTELKEYWASRSLALTKRNEYDADNRLVAVIEEHTEEIGLAFAV